MRQFAQFAFAGTLGYLVDAGTLLAVLTLTGPYLGRVVSFLAAVTTTWLINRGLTFRGHPRLRPLHREFGLYLLTALAGGAVNLASYTALVYALDLRAVHLPAAVAVGSLAGMLVNYALSKHVVFAKRRIDRDAAQELGRR